MAVEIQPVDTNGTLIDSAINDVIMHVSDLARSRAYYEDKLGLRVMWADDRAIAFDGGGLRMWLVDAAEAGVRLTGKPNDCTDLVFLADDCLALREALRGRGVEPVHQRTYSVGTVVDFYDPDGHRLMLYEPSEHAMETEVAGRLSEVWGQYGRGRTGLIGPPSAPIEQTLIEAGLDGKPPVYMFFFLEDIVAAGEFFEQQLELRVLQYSHCCSDECGDGAPGVVKYDGGPVILSTHHIHGHETVLDDAGQPYAARQTDPVFCKGLAPAFRVDDLDRARARLLSREVRFRDDVRSLGGGRIAAFDAPSGHLFYLHEPVA